MSNDFINLTYVNYKKQINNNTQNRHKTNAIKKIQIKDTFETSKKNYNIDDGKISFQDKAKNFAKGIISPIKTMFSSPKNIAVSAVTIVGGSLLIAATGGAIAPFMIAAGVIGGGIQLGTSAYKAAKATTDEEAILAWQGIGAGTSAVVGSVAGAKGALKASGVNTQSLNPVQATIQCFKQIPSSVSKSFNTFKSGAFVGNIKNTLHLKKKQNKAEIENEAKSRIEAEVEAKRKADISQEAYKQNHEKNLSNKSAEESAKAMEKAFEGKEKIKTQKSKELINEITKNDGTKINLTRNENGQIVESNINKPDGTIITKEYTNGKCTNVTSIKKVGSAYFGESKTFEYSNNGKILKIDTTLRSGQEIKFFNYKNGQLESYQIASSKTGEIRTYNLNNELVEVKSNFDDDIKAAIDMLERNNDFRQYNTDSEVIREIKLFNKSTGEYEKAYITKKGKTYRIYSKDSKELGRMLLTDARDYNKLKNFSPEYRNSNSKYIDSLSTINLGDDRSTYKGIGTELVKQAVIESYKEGHGGRIYLEAANFTQQGGRMAESFYAHIGLIPDDGLKYALPEYKIAEFLRK